MRLDDYQQKAGRTAVFSPERGLEYLALGLASEAGEVAGKAKKLVRGDRALDEAARAALRDELGDVLWYVAGLAAHLDYTLSEVAEANLCKLQSRAERGTLRGDGDGR